MKKLEAQETELIQRLRSRFALPDTYDSGVVDFITRGTFVRFSIELEILAKALIRAFKEDLRKCFGRNAE